MARRALHIWFPGTALFALCLTGALAAGKTQSPIPGPRASKPGTPLQIDFDRDIRSILVERCITCHGPNLQQGGLRLDRRKDALKGGKSGPAFKPSHGASSLLIRYVSGANPKLVMPPGGDRLSQTQVALLRSWIDQGAPWSTQGGAISGEAQGRHWAFRAPVLPPLPKVKNSSWVRNPIDAFVLARLEKEKLQPSPTADRNTLIRRLYLDLTGLLPDPSEVQAFVQDQRPDAYERLVDRLLNSEHSAERWARHWLDLARYADSDGYEKDLPRPYAYLYRDWVINALHADMPFDQFTLEQLAGDLLPNATLSQKIATGFHRNTLKNKEGGVDPEEDRVKCVVDRASTTGTVWLGLSVGCAECHDHKYDPISQKEFYGLYAFFNSANEADIPAPTPAETAAHEQAKKRFEEERNRLKEAIAVYEKDMLPMRLAEWEKGVKSDDPKLPPRIAETLATAPEQRSQLQKTLLEQYYRTLDPELTRLTKALTDLEKNEPTSPATLAQTLAENPKPPATHLHIRGDFLRPGDPVSPHTLAVLNSFQAKGETPNRLNLTRWLVHPDNPLTARVAVNRVWQHLFGRGLVATPNDFGTRGERPSHPELLDWLAVTFQTPAAKPGSPQPDLACGWSQKRLIRLIVTSNTYRQSSRDRADLRERDPRNILLARQSRFRPEAEIIRDLNLSASGLLHPAVGGPSIRPPLPADIAALGYANSVRWNESTGPDRYRRGMYIFFQRTVPYPMLATFDAPDSNVTCTRRERSNTPLQALTLLNDPVFFECAQGLARRIVKEGGVSVSDRLRYAYLACLGRYPSEREMARLTQLHTEMRQLCSNQPEAARKLAGEEWGSGTETAEAGAWVVVARTILNLDEFMTRE